MPRLEKNLKRKKDKRNSNIRCICVVLSVIYIFFAINMIDYRVSSFIGCYDELVATKVYTKINKNIKKMYHILNKER